MTLIFINRHNFSDIGCFKVSKIKKKVRNTLSNVHHYELGFSKKILWIKSDYIYLSRKNVFVDDFWQKLGKNFIYESQ